MLRDPVAGSVADSSIWREPTSTVVTVTVTFYPDLAVLSSQIKKLPREAFKVIVDNASGLESIAALRHLVACIPRTYLLENAVNYGLAAALNLGAKHARDLSDASYLLFLDQDTEAPEGSVDALVRVYEQLVSAGLNPGCIGPRLLDPATGLEHGFHQIVGWRWLRRYPPATSDVPVPCSNLNCSGTLVARETFERLGGFDESLFLDHLDTEWSFRVLAAGHRLYGIPSVCFVHRMGDASFRFWFLRWRLWPYRAPQRHYYLFRNAVRLMGRAYVPFVWKAWAVVKLSVTASVHLIFDRRRYDQLTAMFRGVRDGWREARS